MARAPKDIKIAARSAISMGLSRPDTDSITKMLVSLKYRTLNAAIEQAIMSERRRCESEYAVLVEAVRFYANQDDWDDFRSDEMASAYDRNEGSKLGGDMGEKARLALAEFERD